MKTLLNLLPEPIKKKIQSRLHFRFFLWQLFLVFSLEISYLIILLSIYFTLNYQLETLQKTGEQQNVAYTEQKTLDVYQQKFKEMNATLEEVGRIEQQHLSFARILVLLDRIVPERVALEHLKTKEYTVILSGQAVTRDDLLAFDARLKESECIKNVNIPISNLFSQDNVEFQIDFEMKTECLKHTSL